jgi:predicted DNA-binding protein (MmcQ/YjbR family)
LAKARRTLNSTAKLALTRLRAAAASLTGTEESVSFGNPTLRVKGKVFAVIDRYHDRDCLWLRIETAERSELLKRCGWFASPYDPRQNALCCELDQFDWRSVRPLLRTSYGLACHEAGKGRNPKEAVTSVRFTAIG